MVKYHDCSSGLKGSSRSFAEYAWLEARIEADMLRRTLLQLERSGGKLCPSIF